MEKYLDSRFRGTLTIWGSRLKFILLAHLKVLILSPKNILDLANYYELYKRNTLVTDNPISGFQPTVNEIVLRWWTIIWIKFSILSLVVHRRKEKGRERDSLTQAFLCRFRGFFSPSTINCDVCCFCVVAYNMLTCFDVCLMTQTKLILKLSRLGV